MKVLILEAEMVKTEANTPKLLFKFIWENNKIYSSPLSCTVGPGGLFACLGGLVWF